VSRHKGGEGEQMKALEPGIEPFAVSGEAAKVCGPREAAFDKPAAGQQHEPAFRHGMFFDFGPQPVFFGGFCAFGPVYPSST